jgi:hypothetical protein
LGGWTLEANALTTLEQRQSQQRGVEELELLLQVCCLQVDSTEILPGVVVKFKHPPKISFLSHHYTHCRFV